MIALIPARASSERVVGKNTRDFCGQPLVEWTLRAAKESGMFSETWVTTDDKDVAGIAKGLDAYVHDRHPFLAADDTSMRETLLAFCWDVAAEGPVCVLYPTYPLRTAQDVRDIADAYAACGEAVIGVVGGGPELRTVTFDGRGAVHQMHPQSYRTQTETKRNVSADVYCHFACVVNASELRQSTTQLFPATGACPMRLDDRRERTFEVDTYEDFAIAEAIMRMGGGRAVA